MSFRTAIAAATIAAAAIAATPTVAATIVITGSTTNGPTFNRPLAGTPPTGTSGVGTATAYNAFFFGVPTSGAYDFLLTSTTATYDPFLILYSGTFNPSTPLVNAIIANDDLTVGNFTQSGFTRTLTAGTTYIAVVTGFDNTDFGNYTLTITSAIPEPATWAMLIGGFGVLGGAMRRRARVRTTVRFA